MLWLGTVTAQPKKPNVLIFMADDMGIGDTSAYLGIHLMPNTKAIAKNSASRVSHRQAALKKAKTRNNAARTGFLTVTTNRLDTTRMVAKI